MRQHGFQLDFFMEEADVGPEPGAAASRYNDARPRCPDGRPRRDRDVNSAMELLSAQTAPALEVILSRVMVLPARHDPSPKRGTDLANRRRLGG